MSPLLSSDEFEKLTNDPELMESFKKLVRNPLGDWEFGTYTDRPAKFDPDSIDAIKYALIDQARDYERLVLGRWGSSDPLLGELEHTMNDIELILSFDYSNDNQFVPPSVQQAGLVEIDPADEAAIAKDAGWFSVWGKELTGIESSKRGGNAFEGDWIFCRKVVKMRDHPDHKGTLVPAEIVVHASLKHNLPNSPVVFAFSLDGLRYCTLLHKRNAPGYTDTQDLVGDWRETFTQLKGAQLPYPANSRWREIPGFESYKKTIAQQALARNIVDVDIRLKVSDELTVGFGVLDSKFGSGSPNNIFAPMDVSKSPMTQDPQVVEVMTNARNANDGIVALVDYSASKGLIGFDSAPTSKPKMQQTSSFASLPFGSARQEKAIKGIPGVPFDPPDGLELPDPPDGFSWALNLRGVMFLEEHSNPGQPLWPWDVFDMQQYREEFDSDPDDDDLRIQVDRLEKLFKFMRDVGDGIVMNCKIFGLNDY